MSSFPLRLLQRVNFRGLDYVPLESGTYSAPNAFHNSARAPRLTGSTRLTGGSSLTSHSRPSAAFVILTSEWCILAAELRVLAAEVAGGRFRGGQPAVE